MGKNLIGKKFNIRKYSTTENRISVCLDDWTNFQIKELSIALKNSKSKICRTFLNEYIKQNEVLLNEIIDKNNQN